MKFWIEEANLYEFDELLNRKEATDLKKKKILVNKEKYGTYLLVALIKRQNLERLVFVAACVNGEQRLVHKALTSLESSHLGCLQFVHLDSLHVHAALRIVRPFKNQGH